MKRSTIEDGKIRKRARKVGFQADAPDSGSEEEQKPIKPVASDDEVEGEEDATGEDWGGGFKIEPFNLKKEREEGKFDSEGNYIMYRDTDAKKRDVDAWLAAMDEEKGGKKGKKNKDDDRVDYVKVIIILSCNSQCIFQLPKRPQQKEEDSGLDTQSDSQLKELLYSHLLDGETVAAGMGVRFPQLTA
jgi:hypothetical protein